MAGEIITLVEASTFTVLRRSIISALYLATITTIMVAAPDISDLLKPKIGALIPIIIGLALPFAHGTYEIFMPFHRWVSVRPTMKGFRHVVKRKHGNLNMDYDCLREWRSKFFDKPTSERLKVELKKDLAMRQQLTYLFSNCWSAMLFTILIGMLNEGKRAAMWNGIGVCLILSAITALGHWNRSYTLGRTYGYAYLSWLAVESNHKSI